MDAADAGHIPARELEEPLMALGVAASAEQLRALLRSFQPAEDGRIRFEEFLLIMLAVKRREEGSGSSINAFFEKVLRGEASSAEGLDPALSFKLNFSQYRRKKIIDAITLPEGDVRKIKAQAVMHVC